MNRLVRQKIPSYFVLIFLGYLVLVIPVHATYTDQPTASATDCTCSYECPEKAKAALLPASYLQSFWDDSFKSTDILAFLLPAAQSTVSTLLEKPSYGFEYTFTLPELSWSPFSSRAPPFL